MTVLPIPRTIMGYRLELHVEKFGEAQVITMMFRFDGSGKPFPKPAWVRYKYSLNIWAKLQSLFRTGNFAGLFNVLRSHRQRAIQREPSSPTFWSRFWTTVRFPETAEGLSGRTKTE